VALEPALCLRPDLDSCGATAQRAAVLLSVSTRNSPLKSDWCLDRGAVLGAAVDVREAMRNRVSLRKTALIHAPQHSPPTNELCQYTPYGFAS